MQIYIARPIDRANSGEDVSANYREVAEYIQTELDTFPVSVFCPGLAWTLAGKLDHDTSERLMETNMEALRNSNVLILLYYPGRESWGVPQELMMAAGCGIETYVVGGSTPYDDLPINMKSMIEEMDTFETLEEVVMSLRCALEMMKNEPEPADT